MWKHGKWTYADGPEEAPSASQPQRHDPPSPPWQLGTVPVETTVFKDGRRMSKRFERLDRPAAPPARERSKSVVSSSPSIGIPKPPEKRRKASAAPLARPDPDPPRPSRKTPPPASPDLSPTAVPPPVPEASEEPAPHPPSPSDAAPEHPPDAPLATSQSDEPAPAPHIALSVVPPMKRFKAWEALKSIQTDGAEVAEDLKLIHEASILSQQQIKKSSDSLSSSSDLTELSSTLSSISSLSPSPSASSSDNEDQPLNNIERTKRPIRRKKLNHHDKKKKIVEEKAPNDIPGYIKIKSNLWPYRKAEVSELPPATCGCTEGGCGDKCINRAMHYLCDPKRCLLGQSCTNIPLNLRKDLIDETNLKTGKGLKIFWTGNQSKRGWGLKTEIKLYKDVFIIDYRGEIISREKCYKRVLNDYREEKSFYFLDYDGSDVIDAGKKGNCSRFINHSCEPNLRVERFKLSGLEEYQFGLFTLRDIEPDEELCYNYNWQDFSDIAPTSNIRTSITNPKKDDEEAEEDEEEDHTATAPTVQRCYCGTKTCKGFLGVRKTTTVTTTSTTTSSTKTTKTVVQQRNRRSRRRRGGDHPTDEKKNDDVGDDGDDDGNGHNKRRKLK